VPDENVDRGRFDSDLHGRLLFLIWGRARKALQYLVREARQVSSGVPQTCAVSWSCCRTRSYSRRARAIGTRTKVARVFPASRVMVHGNRWSTSDRGESYVFLKSNSNCLSLGAVDDLARGG